MSTLRLAPLTNSMESLPSPVALDMLMIPKASPVSSLEIRLRS